jgi:hypothetical protein
MEHNLITLFADIKRKKDCSPIQRVASGKGNESLMTSDGKQLGFLPNFEFKSLGIFL